jgi:hypothetical protein
MPTTWWEYYTAASYLNGAQSLPPSASKVLFISKAAPRAAGEVMTLSPCDIGTYSLCMIKGDDITFPDSRRLCRLCINVLEPHRRGHMATVTPFDQWVVCHFLGGKSISDHC